jgi:hypothetical protein
MSHNADIPLYLYDVYDLQCIGLFSVCKAFQWLWNRNVPLIAIINTFSVCVHPWSSMNVILTTNCDY